MHTDESGYFFWFLIAAIVIGAVAGGTINGIQAYNQGARGRDLLGSILGGVIMGGAMGAIMAIGGAAGFATLGIGISGFSLTNVAAFGLSISIGIGAGMLSYTAETNIRSDLNFSWGKLFLTGIMSGFQAAATFGIAFWGGKSGVFTKNLTKMTPSDFLKYIFSTQNSITKSQAFVYGTQILFSTTISKFILTTFPSTFIRWAIEKIIRN